MIKRFTNKTMGVFLVLFFMILGNSAFANGTTGTYLDGFNVQSYSKFRWNTELE